MRIGFIGNCQATMVHACTRFLTTADLDYWSPPYIQKILDEGGEGALRDLVSPFDAIIAQPIGSPAEPEPIDAIVKAAARKWVGIPIINFSALHPDLIGVNALPDRSREVLSPLGGCHSALTVFGYLKAYTVAETLSLFRPDVMQRVGYRSAWSYAQRRFEAQCAALGFPGREALARWSRQGVFLHTTTHPKLFVMEDIARTALAMAGVTCRVERCSDYLHDGLLEQVWPVYPDIAAAYGVRGSYLFRRQNKPKPPLDRFPAQMDLQTFVQGSYELYRMFERREISAPRPDGWLSDARILETLRPL